MKHIFIIGILVLIICSLIETRRNELSASDKKWFKKVVGKALSKGLDLAKKHAVPLLGKVGKAAGKAALGYVKEKLAAGHGGHEGHEGHGGEGGEQ